FHGDGSAYIVMEPAPPAAPAVSSAASAAPPAKSRPRPRPHRPARNATRSSMTIARLTAYAIALAITVGASPARAQSPEADVLFREGKKLLKDGQIAEACEKLDASERLQSTVGTLLNLADCRERNHQLATAWATFRKAAVAAKKA